MSLPPILLIDFDGTLCENAYPAIGEVKISKIDKRPIIDKVIEMGQVGWYIILWTCRTGKELEDAITWSGERGLFFDKVNDDHPDAHEAFGITKPCDFSRKPFAHLTIDDRVMNVEDF